MNIFRKIVTNSTLRNAGKELLVVAVTTVLTKGSSFLASFLKSKGS